MLENDRMVVTILKDGTIKTVTDSISAENHDSAEQFLQRMQELAGGDTTRETRGEHAHDHHHHHDHTQEH